MKPSLFAASLIFAAASVPAGCRSVDTAYPAGLGIQTVAPADDPLVNVATTDPRIRVRAVYATPDNFVGETLYPVARIYLRASALERLSRVQDALESRGLGLLVFDGYRPWSVTKRMWDVIGDPDFVADPSRGSRHNRGMAVDLTLAGPDGEQLLMPTKFDAFEAQARADAEVLEPMRRNRDLLIEVMAAEGFRVLSSEWWHFDLDGWESKSLLDVPIEQLPHPAEQ